MLSFGVALTNVATALIYLLPGYVLKKWGKIKAEHLKSFSMLLVYGCTPFMTADAFLKLDHEQDYLGRMALFFIVTLAAQGLFMLITAGIFRKKQGEDRYRMLTIASVMGNVGFFGLPIIRALLPGNPEAAVYSVTFSASMNVFVFSIGVDNLTRDRKFISLKSAICNPAVLSFIAGLILYLARADSWLPQAVKNATSVLGSITTPFCMMILGVRLATMPMKDIFGHPFNYLIALSKLILFPLFSYLLVAFLPLDPVFKASVLVLSSTPSATNILNLAEMHGCNQRLAADCVLLSTLICIVTIPLLTLLV